MTRTPHNPNMLLWNFKYLIPADHLAQLVFVLWSNGVPTIKPGFSGYLKIGPKPCVAEHPMISCEPLEALSLGSTNVVQWDVLSGFWTHSWQLDYKSAPTSQAGDRPAIRSPFRAPACDSSGRIYSARKLCKP